MPAILAVPRTSPLGVSPCSTIAAVSGATRMIARATARRSLGCLSPTSTIRACPCSSRWVKSGGGMRSHRVFDQLAHVVDPAVAQELDRVGLATDDRLKELL